MTTRINGRDYTVEVLPEAGEAQRTDLRDRGWDGNNYILRGVRGAVRLAFRSAKTGEFVIVG